jgi:hypothetical protein
MSDIACNKHEIWKYYHHILHRRNAKFLNVEASGKYNNYCALKNITSVCSLLPFKPFKTIISA